MSKIELIKEESGNCRLVGDLTFDTVNLMLKEQVFSDQRSVDIDLSGVSHSDSSGLALLIEWLRQAKKQSIDVRFKHIPSKMMALAKVSNLDKVLPLVSH